MKFPLISMVFIGIGVAAWVVYGRGLFGLLGDYTALYTMLLGIPILLLHFFIGVALRKTKALGHETKTRVWYTLITAWVLLAVLAMTLPDKIEGVNHAVLTGDTPGRIGMAIGISNPLGIIGVGMLVATLILALLDTRDPNYDEDAIIDLAES